jgi:hypothetical protein
MKCKDKKTCPCNKNHECDGKCGDRMACKNKGKMKSEKMEQGKMPKPSLKKPSKKK